MPETLARVPTPHAAKYLQQLCKHWAHRFEVDFTPDHAVVALPEARLTLNAFPEALPSLDIGRYSVWITRPPSGPSPTSWNGAILASPRCAPTCLLSAACSTKPISRYPWR
jgi:Uncharacterized protein conserved in bacteria (DUF2218)